MARQIELSEDAHRLVAKVSALDEELARMRLEFAADLANVRAEVEKEIGRVQRARIGQTGAGSPERQASRLASETDRFIACQHRLLAERDGLRAEELQRVAEARAELASERDALIAEADCRIEAGRVRMQAQFDEALAKRERELDAEREHLHARVAQRQAEVDDARLALDRADAAFEAAIAGRRYMLAGLIGEAWADYERTRADIEADALVAKSHPAFRAAEFLRAKKRELGEARRRAKRAEWVLAFYEDQFPWLSELRDLEEEEDYVAGERELEEELQGEDGDGEVDPSRRWLSAEEWASLAPVERHQRALDRYLASRKTRWQLGRDYERYVGYLREQDGCRVTYQGIFAGLEDLGRDLLAERDRSIEVIQCKRWAQRKTIHEKHIFQLFGTVVACRIEHPGKEISGTFVTTTSLSQRAHQFAKQLGIRVQERFPLGEYPRIKCNVSIRDGERIYHLPMDQQYDTTLISPERGEAWVATTAEAEALGFRRAWRWRGVDSLGS